MDNFSLEMKSVRGQAAVFSVFRIRTVALRRESRRVLVQP